MDSLRVSRYVPTVSDAPDRPSNSRADAARWWSGAPALAAWWLAAIWAGTVACGGRIRFEEHYRGGSIFWLIVGALGVLTLCAHLALVLRDRRDAERGAAQPHDEAHGLRLLSGTVASLGAGSVLWVWLRWASGSYGPGRLYADAGEFLGRIPGVSAAVLLAAFSGLYLSESLPRSPWDGEHGPSARRLFRLLAMLVGATFFVLTVNVISHFSVGRALLYTPH